MCLKKDLVQLLSKSLEASNRWGGCDFRFDPPHHIASIEFKLSEGWLSCDTKASTGKACMLLLLLSLPNKTASVSLFNMDLWDWTTCRRRSTLLWSSGKDCKLQRHRKQLDQSRYMYAYNVRSHIIASDKSRYPQSLWLHIIESNTRVTATSGLQCLESFTVTNLFHA